MAEASLLHRPRGSASLRQINRYVDASGLHRRGHRSLFEVET
jgi:hypothetical protein